MQPTLQFGRRPDQDMWCPKPRLRRARHHALASRPVIVEIGSSTNGTYADFLTA